jgi:hypothetical protein
MDSGVHCYPPMMFINGMHNYGTQSMPWVSNHFSHGMSNMSLHFPSFVSPLYANTSFGSGGMMPPYSHILQTPIMIGGWNLPSYESTMQ